MAIDPVSLGIEAALFAAQMALTMSQTIKGPRLDDLNVTLADYGSPIPRFWGIRRLNPQIMWAEQLKEVKVTTKTKGGKAEDYKYYGTWAALICDHPIDSVARIWMDKHLVYQTRAAGPIAPVLGLGNGPDGSLTKLEGGRNMRVYLGTETQTADPRMETWCEDRYGANSCPAYRGSSYIVFQEIPLEKFGNRIPQITVEVISSKTTAYPYETHPTTLTLDGAVYSPDCTRLMLHSNANFEIWDVPSRTLIVTGVFPVAVTGDLPGIDNNGTIWAVTGGLISSNLSTFTPDGLGYLGADIPITGISGSDGVRIVGYTDTDGTQQTVIFVKNVVGGGVNYLSGGAVISVPLAFNPITYFADGDNAWVAGNSGTTIGFYCVKGPRVGTTHTLTSPASSSSAMSACNPGAGVFVCNQANSWYTIDDTTWAASTPVTIATSSPAGEFERVKPGETSVWVAWQEISFVGPTSLRTLNQSLWAGTSVNRPIYDRINHAIIADDAGTPLMWRFLDRVGSSGVTLSTVVNDVSTWCGLTGQDTSALTQTVLGYSVTQGAGKDMLNPLLDIHDVDARPHDFAVQFVNRGSAPSGTLLTEDFVRANGPRYTVTIKQDTDLPRKTTINFADVDKDQQTNTAIAQRPLDATDSTREDTIDLTTYAETADGAQQKADRFFRRAWNSREGIKLSLTAQKLGLEPGDVTTASLDGSLRHVRLDKMTIAGSQIDCEFIRDEAIVAVLNSATGAVMDGRNPETIYVPAPTKGFVLDTPLSSDADNDINPVVYTGAGSYGSGSWPGAGVWRGDDGTYDTQFASVSPDRNATWGLGTTVLATANYNLWDRGNTVNIKLLHGSLTSATEADINATPSLNLAYLGGEYINFTTATLQVDGSYTLSGLKRGRRGTEWMVAAHVVGEDFVLVSSLHSAQLATDDIGDALKFKVQTFGRNIDNAPLIAMTFAANSLKPYAPAYVKWVYDGIDLHGTLFRRTRIGGNWNGSTIPLSEASEAYEVDIYNGSTFKRTISLSATTAFTYTAAMAAADGITLPTPPTIKAYQLSATVGRGFALAA